MQAAKAGASSATITSVGTLGNKSGTDTTTLPVSPQNAGDLFALAVKVSSSSVTASSVSGGGVNLWTQAANVTESGNELQIWSGTVSTTGASTITVTFSTRVTSIYTGLAAHEFSASSGTSTVWGIDSASGISNTSSTTVTFPKITPNGTGELYFGYAAVANTGSAGTTSGFSYATTSDADVAAYDTSVSSAVQPTAKQSPSGVSGGVAVLITASTSSGTTVPGAPTITSVVPGNGQLTVNFSPGSTGGSPITSFTVTCGGTSVSASGSATSATVSGLTNGTKYSCTVSATNINGLGPPSAAVTGTPSTVAGTPTISAVGSLLNKSGAGTTTVAVSPQHAGDLLLLVVKVSSASITASSVSGGGVSAWTRAAGVSEGNNELQIWTGTVSTTGTSTIIATFSASVTSIYTELAAHEFSASSASATVWGTDSGSGMSNASSTTVTFPNLTPSGTGELYFGYAAVANSGAAGTTSGFSYATTSDADVTAYNTNVSSAVAPTAKQSPVGVSGGVAVLITASTSSGTSPTVTSVSPNSGSSIGGTVVTITGSGFTGATLVSFGVTAASGVTINSDTSITVTDPSGSVGTVDVTVTSPGGTSATSSADRFTYTNVSGPNFTAVGSMTQTAGSTGLASISKSGVIIGDILVLSIQIDLLSSVTATGVSGAGTTGWTQLVVTADPSVSNMSMWMGTATATSVSITPTYSGSLSGGDGQLVLQEFAAPNGAALDVANWAYYSTSQTSLPFPTLTPSSGSAELYVGYCAPADTGTSSGSPSGFVFQATESGYANVFVYDTAVTTAQTPFGTQSTAGTNIAMAALIKVSSGSSGSAPMNSSNSPSSGIAGTSV